MKPMDIAAVLFDKDGTLVDFHAMWIPAYLAGAQMLAERTGRAELAAQLLESTGYRAESGTLVPESLLVVATTTAIVDAWVSAAGLDGDPGAAQALAAVFHEHSRTPRAIVDLPPLLGRLRARGLTLGVATMDSTAGARAGMEELAALPYLDLVIGFDAGFGAKPGISPTWAISTPIGLRSLAETTVGSIRKISLTRSKRFDRARPSGSP